jgi:hypothetical protein
MAATRGGGGVGDATWGDVAGVVACIGASWLSDVVVFTIGHRALVGDAYGVVAGGALGVVAVIVVGSRPLVIAIDGGRRAAFGGVADCGVGGGVANVTARSGGATCGGFVATSVDWRPASMHLLADIEMLLVGRLVVLLLVL